MSFKYSGLKRPRKPRDRLLLRLWPQLRASSSVACCHRWLFRFPPCAFGLTMFRLFFTLIAHWAMTKILFSKRNYTAGHIILDGQVVKKRLASRSNFAVFKVLTQTMIALESEFSFLLYCESKVGSFWTSQSFHLQFSNSSFRCFGLFLSPLLSKVASAATLKK